MNGRLERLFPALRGVSYEITSPAQPDYNCIAWAAGDTSRWWEPDESPFSYWPERVSREYTLEAYAEAFRRFGFEDCGSPDLEAGWEKVALFSRDDRVPSHAARQLPDGTWTSKLGKLEDIKHADLDHVSGEHYGGPVLILRRRRGGTKPIPEEASP